MVLGYWLAPRGSCRRRSGNTTSIALVARLLEAVQGCSFGALLTSPVELLLYLAAKSRGALRNGFFRFRRVSVSLRRFGDSQGSSRKAEKPLPHGLQLRAPQRRIGPIYGDALPPGPFPPVTAGPFRANLWTPQPRSPPSVRQDQASVSRSGCSASPDAASPHGGAGSWLQGSGGVGCEAADSCGVSFAAAGSCAVGSSGS